MTTVISPEDLILVTGATGGVGQLTVGKLLEKGLKVRILTRNAQKAATMFNNRVEVAIGDICNPDTLSNAVAGVSYIINAAGTTAFPSDRWQFNSSWNWLEAIRKPQQLKAKAANSPEKVDAEGVINLVKAAPRDLKRFVFVSSCGIVRKEDFPFKILNAFGVLDAKKKGEEAIISSGLPYTIIRPGRLIDGPFTSYDLNTLLQATTKGKVGVVVGTGDKLSGDTSRIDVAAACVESLGLSRNLIFEIVNKGQRPSVIDWETLLAGI